MSQVDFYILTEQSSKEHFACILIQKIWRQGHSVFIHTASATTAAVFDELLWTFKDTSFVPHKLVTDDNNENMSILIGYGQQTDAYLSAHKPVVLNVADQIPAVFSNVPRILEIVASDELEPARKRYTNYQHQGHVLYKHMIDSHYGPR